MIDEVVLKLTHGGLSFNPTPITVVVGPNGGGKSLALREIEILCTTSHQANILVESLKLSEISADDALRILEPYKVSSPRRDAVFFSRPTPAEPEGVVQVSFSPSEFKSVLTERSNQGWIAENFTRFVTIRLDGRTRFALSEPKPAGDTQERPKNAFMALLTNDPARERLRALTHRALGKYLVIDPTAMLTVRARLSDRPPSSGEELGIDQVARSFHENALELHKASDGTRSYVGILLAVVSGDYRVLLIDEPEAFLHPPLARRLGQDLCELASERNATMVVATHSADFLIGCIESGRPVNLVRLTNIGGVSNAMILSAPDLTPLMRHPLLRSTGALSALFHNGAIVTEADSDRSFYSEIAFRDREALGARDIVFLNAQNKQTIWTIIDPLRRIGVPAAAIVDVDFVKDGGGEFTRALKAAQVPPLMFDSLNTLRGQCKTAFERSGRDMKRDGGIDILSPTDREAFSNFTGQLAAYGIFVVQRGEVEAWLPQLGAAGHGSQWLTDIFNRMESDPTDSHYLRPADDDVWCFVRSVFAWQADPNRKGVRGT